MAQWEGGKGGAVAARMAAYGRRNGGVWGGAWAGGWMKLWQCTGRWGAALWHARRSMQQGRCGVWAGICGS